jgi:AmmeMemoRadiSam system protein A
MPAPELSQDSWAGFARRVIAAAAGGDLCAAISPPASELSGHSGVFVTLKRHGVLRGCMGVLNEQLPLAEAVRQAAVCAALHDPRFLPLNGRELAELSIEISILSPHWPMRSIEDLALGVHGVLIRRGEQRGLFLPQVAIEHRLNRETFLSRCCAEKANLAPDAWREPGTEVLLFTTEVIRD